MKGILKIYHPDETLKYHIHDTYCKSIYSNSQHFLEVEINTNDDLDHVDDDSLQYGFPQLTLAVSDFPLDRAELSGQTFSVEDTDDEAYTEVDLHCDEDAYLGASTLCFKTNTDGDLELHWQGTIDDFYTAGDEQIPFQLKCHFREEEPDLAED